MKNVINRTISIRAALVIVAVGCLAAGTLIAQASSPTMISYAWQFAAGNNPAAPDSSSGGAPDATASITPGQGSIGWLSGNAGVFGNADGLWNLGQNGVINLTSSSGLAGTGQPGASLTIKVVQYNDGGIYGGHCGVSVPGAQPISTNTSVAPGLTSGPIGGWIMDEITCSVNAGTAITSIAINAAMPNGSVIDSVTVEAVPNVVQTVPPQLYIQSLTGGQVMVSWSTNYSSMVLESNSDLNNAGGWSAVQLTPQPNGDFVSVVIPASEATRFYRLKQP